MKSGSSLTRSPREVGDLVFEAALSPLERTVAEGEADLRRPGHQRRRIVSNALMVAIDRDWPRFARKIAEQEGAEK